jgi:NAD(P)-dependent dehydrogenase (short-subunit alcohol dehydrogenase family)
MNLYIVTGTTQGLGASLAAAIARDPDNELIALARAPAAAIPGGIRIEVDLADGDALEAAWDRVEAHVRGRPFAKAVLVNNAGVISPVGPLDEVDPAALERSLAVNLVAPLRLMRRFLRMTGGIALRRIINISSGAGRRPLSGWSAYCAAKAGLDMASRVVALEAGERGLAVEVTSLAPGVIDTGMQAVVRGAAIEAFPDVERFRELKSGGKLRPAADVAADILRLEAAGALRGEPLRDIRELA